MTATVPSRLRPVLPPEEFLRTWERGEPAATGRPVSQAGSAGLTRLRKVKTGSVPPGANRRKVPAAHLPLPPRLAANFEARTYGGLSHVRLRALLWRCKAGISDLGAYLLATQWKRELTRGLAPSKRLQQLTLTAIRRAMAENRADFFTALAGTLTLLKSREFREGRSWNHDAAAWWEFHVLLYLLRHPQPDYRIREFRHHLADELGESAVPTPKTLRAFCRRHGIRLDSRPGAPVRP